MSDRDQIKNIEQALNVKLKQREEINWIYSTGYTISEHGVVTGIGLYDCNIGDLQDIRPLLTTLTGLTTLVVSHNQIRDLTPLATLTSLTTLSLNDNRIRDLTPLATLTSLTTLSLNDNRIRDLTPLATLTSLTALELANNRISDLRPLVALVQLMKLALGKNQIQDISPLENLHQLETLTLFDNYIRDISPLKNLKQLRKLHLDHNQIQEITSLAQLQQLATLELSANPIETLPAWINDCNMDIEWRASWKEGALTLYDNPLKTPPPEIVQQGKAAVKNYFDQLQAQAEDYLFEAKMLIVGEPGAGKTTFARKIHNAACELPEAQETTKGIDVTPYYFPLHPEDVQGVKHPEKLADRQFRLNLWDFGGQEIYKATHRFFLSQRALYALVADSRNEDTDFNYWLNLVEMFGGPSPLLIVLNEKYGRKRHLDVAAMRSRFSNIVDVIDVDFAETDPNRLAKLVKAIKHHVSNLPHIGSPIPSRWADVREALEHDERNTLTVQEYLQICQQHGITKREDALVLSQYFHDVGVFLHFQEDDLLRKAIFLKPNWATNAVYKLLDAPLLSQTNGRFTKQQAVQLWYEAEYADLCPELLRLMHKFFLAYQIPDSDDYIVPERLPAAAPQYEWDSHNNLRLHYHYDIFMPKGILSQFIVLMHRYIRNHDLVWRRGVILEREATRAEITETYDARTIKIRLAGPHCRDFMTLIAEQFDQINRQYEKMAVDKLIPCRCAECKAAPEPYFYEYKDLQRRIEKGRPEVECGVSYQMVNVRSLIDDVLNTPDRRRPGKLEKLHLPFDLRQQVVDVLSALPNVHDRQALRALLYSAGIDAELENQLDFALPAAQFFPLLVKTLDDYGTLADDRHPVVAVLQAAKRSVGKELQTMCERLIREIKQEL